MKAFAFSLFMVISAISATAQTYNYLTLQKTDGEEKSLTISGLKITFSDGNLVATNSTSSATIPLSQMQKMYFSSKATGIESAATSPSEINASIVNGRLQLNVPEGSQVQIYSIDGRKMSAESTFTKGVYVVRVGNQSIKILAQ